VKVRWSRESGYDRRSRPIRPMTVNPSRETAIVRSFVRGVPRVVLLKDPNGSRMSRPRSSGVRATRNAHRFAWLSRSRGRSARPALRRPRCRHRPTRGAPGPEGEERLQTRSDSSKPTVRNQYQRKCVRVVRARYRIKAAVRTCDGLARARGPTGRRGRSSHETPAPCVLAPATRREVPRVQAAGVAAARIPRAGHTLTKPRENCCGIRWERLEAVPGSNPGRGDVQTPLPRVRALRNYNLIGRRGDTNGTAVDG